MGTTSTSEESTRVLRSRPEDLGDPLDRAATLAAVRRKLLRNDGGPQPTLSRHVLLRKLGAGGFGLVYEAYDPELDRKVAIKLLKTSSSSSAEEREARLRREAQAIARISHPNVIAVYDVGAYGEAELARLTSTQASTRAQIPPTGVFVVMELVTGPDLRAWMAGDHPWRARLEVLLQAGRGLAAAHAGGLAHRDFKPDNVLVGRDDTQDALRVRVLDFGLARPARSSRLSSGSGDSRESGALDELSAEGTVVGTPAYMSPEQHAGEAPDERSDQYNFCVAAWEVLAGRRPFPKAPLDDLAKLKHTEQIADPPRDNRVPARVWTALRRGLSADPSQRFPSMDALLSALEPPREGRIVRALAIGTLILAPIAVVALRGDAADECEATVEGVREAWAPQTQQRLQQRLEILGRQQSDAIWAKARTRLDAQVENWTTRRLELCRARLDGTSADRVARLEEESLCLERRRIELETALDVLLDEDDSVLSKTLPILEGLQPIEDCADPDAPRPLLPPPGPDRVEAIEILGEIDRASLLGLAGRQARREAVAAGAVARARALEHQPTVARALLVRGAAQWDADALDDAQATFEEALIIAERADDEATALEAMLSRAGVLGKGKRQWETAEQLLDWVEARSDDLLVRLRAERFRGVFLSMQGRLDDAGTVFERALATAEARLGSDALFLSSLLVPLGNVYRGQGRETEATAAYRRALTIRHEVVGASDGDAMLYNNLGGSLMASGEVDEACDSYDRALRMFKQSYGEIHGNVAMALNNVGSCQSVRGEHEQALRTHRRALSIKEQALGDDHPDCGYSLVNIGDSLLALDRPRESLTAHRRALAVWSAALGPDNASLAIPHAGIADASLALDDSATAQEHITAGLAALPEKGFSEVRVRLRFASARLLERSDMSTAVAEVKELLDTGLDDRDPSLFEAMRTWLSEREESTP